MRPNEVFQFVNVINPLVISVCFDEKGITCETLDFFSMQASPFYPHLDAVNYRINFQIFQPTKSTASPHWLK